MNELSRLMHEVSSPEPPDHLDLGAVIGAGRRRRRQRRAAVGGSAALAVVGVLGVGVVVSGGTPAPRPEPAADVAGPVVRLDDAVLAVEGTDYDVLTTRVQREATDETLLGVSDDGLGVVREPAGPSGDGFSVGLLSPADGTTSWLPGGPQRIQADPPIALGEDRLVFRESHWSQERLSVRIFDRAGGSWSTMTWPRLPRAESYSPVVHGDRLYVGLFAESGGAALELWSVSLSDPDDVRDEQAGVVGAVDLTGDEMTWSDGSRGAATRLHVRDLASGEERVVDPGVATGCWIDELERVGDRLLLSQDCGAVGPRVQVVTMEGEPVVTVMGEKVGGIIGDGGRVAVVSGGEGGPYVLDPVTADLWRIGAPMALWIGDQPVPDGSDLALWTTSDWVPSIDGDPEGEGPNEPSGDDDETRTQHLVAWRD